MTAEEMKSSIYERLRSKGYSNAEAAALTANASAESAFDPTADSTESGTDENHSKGLWQFTGQREEDLKQFAANQGSDWSDWKTQTDFVDWELHNTESKAFESMRSRPDATPEEMSDIVQWQYERPSEDDTSAPDRQRAAREIADGTPFPKGAYPEGGFTYLQGLDMNKVDNGVYSGTSIPQIDHPDTEPPSVWNKFSNGVVDSVMSSPLWNMGTTITGDLFHTSSTEKQPISQQDIDYVAKLLQGNEDAQRFVLLNSRDSEEVKWLAAQEVDKQNRRSKLASYGMGWATLGGLVGGLLDPINLIPIGAGANAIKLIGKTAGTITNVAKIAKYAEIGAKAAALNVGETALEGATSSDTKTAKDYAISAGLGFLAGSIGTAVGDKVMNFASKQRDSMKVAAVAHTMEDDALKYASGLPMSNEVRAETLNIAKTFHDPEFLKGSTDANVSRLEGEGKLVAMSLEDAKKLGYKVGKDIEGLSDNTKAFYVPNEGYTILIKDNIPDISKVSNIIKHEKAVHGDLKTVMGEDKYNELLQQVKDGSNTEGTPWYEARRQSGAYDPEETLAYAVENNLLDKGMMRNLADSVNSGFRLLGERKRMNNQDIRKYVAKALDYAANADTGIHYNADGSTAWGGVKFSKDNPLNPNALSSYFRLEKIALKDAQGDLPKGLQTFGKLVEASKLNPNITGLTMNSLSRTSRDIGSKLFVDSRGRGFDRTVSIPAERVKEHIVGQLSRHIEDYWGVRSKYIKENLLSEGAGKKAFLSFDKKVVDYFNAVEAGNKSNAVLDVPDAVKEGAKHLKAYLDSQVEIGKNSSDMVNGAGKNLIEKNWVPIDKEFRRLSTPELIHAFIKNFNEIKEVKKFLKDYYYVASHTGDKFEITRQKIARGLEKENAALEEAGKDIKEIKVSDADVEKYLDEHIPIAVDHMLGLEMHNMEGGIELGQLNFLKERVAMDTSVIKKMPNGDEFSFDNNLRNYNLDHILDKNMRRFAGEASLMSVFKNEKEFTTAMNTAKHELEIAKRDGKLDAGQAAFEFKALEDSIKELRGKRPDRDILQKLGVISRTFQGLSYAKNGANMGFAQMSEVGGAMAYVGTKALFSLVSPLRKLYTEAKLGKVSADVLESLDRESFGSNLERHIWSANYEDSVVRDALTNKSLINSALKGAADAVKVFGKVTSTINMLPHMTDSMTRFCRNFTALDTIKWAKGYNFGKGRNPFSEAKLKACNVSEADLPAIKAAINKYIKVDTDGKPISHNVNEWVANDPTTFWQWKNIVQTQVERAITSGSLIGNRNIIKDSTWYTRLMFQFKDFTTRAVNSQTMRAMTSRDLDDGLAAGFSMFTNVAAAIAKTGATAATMTALGRTAQEVDDYLEQNLNLQQLSKIAFIRSGIIGSPLSPLNDAYEAYSGAPTIRTTVQRNVQRKPQTDPASIIGDYATQLPAVNTAKGYTYDAYKAFAHMTDNTASKRDFKNLLNLIPVPNLIPWTQLVNNMVDQSKYPDKRPSK